MGARAREREGKDVLIVDTAGRLHVDEELMTELAEIKRVTRCFQSARAIGRVEAPISPDSMEPI